MLDNTIGDFQTFLTDEVVTSSASDFSDLVSNANFYLGFCMLEYGRIRSFRASTYSDARRALTEAPAYFQAAQKSDDERLAIVATLFEAECRYSLARLYTMASEKEWEKANLSKMDRTAAITSEIEASSKLVDKMISGSGAHKDLKTFGEMSKYGNDVILGSIGDSKVLNDLLSKLTDIADNKTWGSEISGRIADGVLIQHLIFNGSDKAALSSLGRVAQSKADATYWTGWMNFIKGDYEAARGNFSTYMLKLAADRSTRARLLMADAKYRYAECLFWQGVRSGSIPMLNDAKDNYRALGDPDGQFAQFLSSDIQSMVQTRLFLINIEGSLVGNADVGLFDAAMNFAGLKLPDNADEYLNVGRYFLEKGIRTAEKERMNALAFAQKSFDLVIGSGAVNDELKNRARFMKGVGMVKLATIQDGSARGETLVKARNVLAECRSPLADEAKYVTGISYYIEDKNSEAQTQFKALESRGSIRAAYYLGQTEKNCATQGGYFKKITMSVKDRTNFWYQSADMEFNKLKCKGDVPPQSPYGSIMADPPMTYENLVDRDADIAAKKLEALALWQKTSFTKTSPDIDELIQDKPPETNVTIQLSIFAIRGDEVVYVDVILQLPRISVVIIQDDPYTRKAHLTVKKKGFYLYTDDRRLQRPRQLISL
jgi:hypothetical protein